MKNPRNRKQEVVRIFDGRVHHAALCRGFLDGLPVFGWGEAPSILLTRGQLRDAGLRPAGQDPLALLVFRHVKAYSHETVAPLFSVELAAARREPSPAQLRAIGRALQARRVCVDCSQEMPYYVPTSTRQWVGRFGKLTAATVAGLPVDPVESLTDAIGDEVSAWLAEQDRPSIGEQDHGPVATLDRAGDQHKSTPKRRAVREPKRKTLNQHRAELRKALSADPASIDTTSAESIRKALHCSPQRARQLRDEYRAAE